MRLIGLFVLLFSIQAHSLEFRQINENKYEMIGNFDQYSYVHIREFLNENKGKKLIIVPFSPGGYANDAIDIMRAFRDHGQVAFVVDPKKQAYCYSMCALASAGAAARYGKFGFHPIAATSGVYNYEVQMFNAIVQEYLVYYGMDRKLAQKATMSSPRELHFVAFSGGWK